MAKQGDSSEWKRSARGEAAWKETREGVATRNAETRKAGKAQRETYERERAGVRRAAAAKRDAKAHEVAQVFEEALAFGIALAPTDLDPRRGRRCRHRPRPAARPCDAGGPGRTFAACALRPPPALPITIGGSSRHRGPPGPPARRPPRRVLHRALRRSLCGCSP